LTAERDGGEQAAGAQLIRIQDALIWSVLEQVYNICFLLSDLLISYLWLISMFIADS
jgi:hypothetical protein